MKQTVLSCELKDLSGNEKPYISIQRGFQNAFHVLLPPTTWSQSFHKN